MFWPLYQAKKQAAQKAKQAREERSSATKMQRTTRSSVAESAAKLIKTDDTTSHSRFSSDGTTPQLQKQQQQPKASPRTEPLSPDGSLDFPLNQIRSSATPLTPGVPKSPLVFDDFAAKFWCV